MARLRELLERVDVFCREQRLLTLRADATSSWPCARGTSASSPVRAPARSRCPGPEATSSVEPAGRERRAVRLHGPVVGVVALGGAAGALARYGLSEAFPDRADGFPWTIFAINVVGCLLLALLPALAVVVDHPLLPPLLGTGVLGGFTTLSTYAEQSRALVDGGHAGLAGAYVVGTLAACLLAVAVADRCEQRGGAGAGSPARRATCDAGCWWRWAPRSGRRCATSPATCSTAGCPAARSLVNWAGSLLLGGLSGLGLAGDALALLGTGFCGGLTTYSVVRRAGARPRPAPRLVGRAGDPRTRRCCCARSASPSGRAERPARVPAQA